MESSRPDGAHCLVRSLTAAAPAGMSWDCGKKMRTAPVSCRLVCSKRSSVDGGTSSEKKKRKRHRSRENIAALCPVLFSFLGARLSRKPATANYSIIRNVLGAQLDRVADQEGSNLKHIILSINLLVCRPAFCVRCRYDDNTGRQSSH